MPHRPPDEVFTKLASRDTAPHKSQKVEEELEGMTEGQIDDAVFRFAAQLTQVRPEAGAQAKALAKRVDAEKVFDAMVDGRARMTREGVQNLVKVAAYNEDPATASRLVRHLDAASPQGADQQALSALVRSAPGNVEGAQEILQRVRDRGLIPNHALYHAALVTCSRARRPDDAFAILDRMVEEGVHPTQKEYAAAVEALVMAGQLEKARQTATWVRTRLFTLEPCVEMYDALIMLSARDKVPHKASRYLEELRADGLTETVETMNRVIWAMGTSPDTVRRGELYFEDMVLRGMMPNRRTFHALIHNCSSLPAGFKHAEEVLQRMPEYGLPIRGDDILRVLRVFRDTARDEAMCRTVAVPATRPAGNVVHGVLPLKELGDGNIVVDRLGANVVHRSIAILQPGDPAVREAGGIEYARLLGRGDEAWWDWRARRARELLASLGESDAAEAARALEAVADAPHYVWAREWRRLMKTARRRENRAVFEAMLAEARAARDAIEDEAEAAMAKAEAVLARRRRRDVEKRRRAIEAVRESAPDDGPSGSAPGAAPGAGIEAEAAPAGAEAEIAYAYAPAGSARGDAAAAAAAERAMPRPGGERVAASAGNPVAAASEASRTGRIGSLFADSDSEGEYDLASVITSVFGRRQVGSAGAGPSAAAPTGEWAGSAATGGSDAGEGATGPAAAQAATDDEESGESEDGEMSDAAKVAEAQAWLASRGRVADGPEGSDGGADVEANAASEDAKMKARVETLAAIHTRAQEKAAARERALRDALPPPLPPGAPGPRVQALLRRQRVAVTGTGSEAGAEGGAEGYEYEYVEETEEPAGEAGGAEAEAEGPHEYESDYEFVTDSASVDEEVAALTPPGRLWKTPESDTASDAIAVQRLGIGADVRDFEASAVRGPFADEAEDALERTLEAHKEDLDKFAPERWAAQQAERAENEEKMQEILSGRAAFQRRSNGTKPGSLVLSRAEQSVLNEAALHTYDGRYVRSDLQYQRTFGGGSPRLRPADPMEEGGIYHRMSEAVAAGLTPREIIRRTAPRVSGPGPASYQAARAADEREAATRVADDWAAAMGLPRERARTEVAEVVAAVREGRPPPAGWSVRDVLRLHSLLERAPRALGMLEGVDEEVAADPTLQRSMDNMGGRTYTALTASWTARAERDHAFWTGRREPASMRPYERPEGVTIDSEPPEEWRGNEKMGPTAPEREVMARAAAAEGGQRTAGATAAGATGAGPSMAGLAARLLGGDGEDDSPSGSASAAAAGRAGAGQGPSEGEFVPQRAATPAFLRRRGQRLAFADPEAEVGEDVEGSAGEHGGEGVGRSTGAGAGAGAGVGGRAVVGEHAGAGATAGAAAAPASAAVPSRPSRRRDTLDALVERAAGAPAGGALSAGAPFKAAWGDDDPVTSPRESDLAAEDRARRMREGTPEVMRRLRRRAAADNSQYYEYDVTETVEEGKHAAVSSDYVWDTTSREDFAEAEMRDASAEQYMDTIDEVMFKGDNLREAIQRRRSLRHADRSKKTVEELAAENRYIDIDTFAAVSAETGVRYELEPLSQAQARMRKRVTALEKLYASVEGRRTEALLAAALGALQPTGNVGWAIDMLREYEEAHGVRAGAAAWNEMVRTAATHKDEYLATRWKREMEERGHRASPAALGEMARMAGRRRDIDLGLRVLKEAHERGIRLHESKLAILRMQIERLGIKTKYLPPDPHAWKDAAMAKIESGVRKKATAEASRRLGQILSSVNK